MHNFKIARSHNEASAIRDWAKSIGVDKEQIEVKLVTEDMKLAESTLLELVRENYEVEAEVKERDRLNEPLITTYDIYNRIRASSLDMLPLIREFLQY